MKLITNFLKIFRKAINDQCFVLLRCLVLPSLELMINYYFLMKTELISVVLLKQTSLRRDDTFFNFILLKHHKKDKNKEFRWFGFYIFLIKIKFLREKNIANCTKTKKLFLKVNVNENLLRY